MAVLIGVPSAHAALSLTITPTSVPAAGGVVTVTGSGFSANGVVVMFRCTNGTSNCEPANAAGTMSQAIGTTDANGDLAPIDVQIDPPVGFACSPCQVRGFNDFGFAYAVVQIGPAPPTNSPPTAVSASLTLNEDSPLALTLQGNDPENQALTYAVTTAPIHGSLTGAPPNLTYTPAANYAGLDSLQFTVSDGQATSAPATVQFTINAINDRPTANPQQVAVFEDGTKAITLTGSDPENSAVTYTVTANPLHGMLSGVPPNVTYRPPPNYNGADSFTFTTRDAGLTSEPATVSISVTPVNDAPSISPQSFTMRAEGAPTQFTLQASDAESNPITFQVVQPPDAGDLINHGGGSFTYTPIGPDVTTDSFTIRVSDGSAASPPVKISLAAIIDRKQEKVLNDSYSTPIICTNSNGIKYGCGSFRQAFRERLHRHAGSWNKPIEISLDDGYTYANWHQTNGFVPYGVCIEDTWVAKASTIIVLSAPWDVTNFTAQDTFITTGNLTTLRYSPAKYCFTNANAVRNANNGANYSIQVSVTRGQFDSIVHKQIARVYFTQTAWNNNQASYTHTISDTVSFTG
jgi:hypothetical protein